MGMLMNVIASMPSRRSPEPWAQRLLEGCQERLGALSFFPTEVSDESQSRNMLIWTFAITSLALFMVTLDNLVVTTALPVIRRDLHASSRSSSGRSTRTR